ncbi:MAG: peroxidase family protein, partial [Pirellulaceae bacterium]
MPRRSPRRALRRADRLRTRRSYFEPLETRQLLAVDWRNPVDALDVTGDGRTVPLDALSIINELNRNGTRRLSDVRDSDKPYWDANGDQFIAPLDALRVVNGINSGKYAPFRLQEHGVLADEANITITVGQSAGTRTYRLEILPTFDNGDGTAVSEDLLAVYVVNPQQPDETLIDRGDAGTAVFTLSASGAEIVPGLTRWDGRVLELDLSRLSGRDTALLRVQLLSSDGDSGSRMSVQPLTNVVNPNGNMPSAGFMQESAHAPGAALTVEGLSPLADIEARLDNVRFDATAGRYEAELKVRNTGSGTPRTLVAAFPGLPAGVTLRNVAGTAPGGAPLLNLTPAIGRGGLGANEWTAAVAIKVDVTANTSFVLAPQFLGSANRAPAVDALPPQTMYPGEVLELQLAATDPDGDALSYALVRTGGTAPGDTLPAGIVRTDGSVVFQPAPDELGTYTFDIVVSDGSLEARQAGTLEVLADPNQTTRISGVVQNTAGEPLDGVPVEIAGFSAVTDTDGRFTIELPTMVTPTQSFEIAVPQGDVFLDPFNTGAQLIRFRRAPYDVATGDSVLNPREHSNRVTHFIDASMVYGSDAARAAALRTFVDGKLKMGTDELLPRNDPSTFPDGALSNDNEGRQNPATLFVSGDVRTNENVALIALHTVLSREHNRLAVEIKSANPGWNDEQIYQQARRLVGAMVQHITYQEYLPQLLGTGFLPAYAGYDPAVDPSESMLFAAAAFRLGHTQVPTELKQLDANGQPLPGGTLTLANAFFTTQPIDSNGIEPLLRGLAATPMQEVDRFVRDDVRNFLFGPPGAGGMDLASMNIQRGRDVGLPGYVQARLDFGLPAVTQFDQISSDPATVAALESAYGTVDKIDVWVGGIAEDHAAGAQVGPLFQAILRDQFTRSRDGDRYYYENGQFTAAELALIRATTVEALVERNADNVDLPVHPFTTGTPTAGPGQAGSAAAATSTDFRSVSGAGNNLSAPQLGAAGTHVLRNFTNGYGDGISTPAGDDRPGAREI